MVRSVNISFEVLEEWLLSLSPLELGDPEDMTSQKINETYVKLFDGIDYAALDGIDYAEILLS